MSMAEHSAAAKALGYRHITAGEAPRQRTLRIIREVANRYDVDASDIFGPSHRRQYAWPRQEVMWTLRQETKLTTTQIGDLLGGRHHTTILHGLAAHAKRMGQG